MCRERDRPLPAEGFSYGPFWLLSIRSEWSRQMTMYRQGDLLFVRDEGEVDSPEIPRDERGRIVLAEGEATGHAHAVLSPEARLRGALLGDRFLEVLAQGGVDVVHEEHASIHLEQGTWRVVRQREFAYSRTGWGQSRWIAD